MRWASLGALAAVGATLVFACAKGVVPLEDEDSGAGCSGVDLKTDPKHCGACDVVCPSGQVCSNGQCKAMCDSPLTKCSGDAGAVCLDLKSDPNRCGSCTNVCRVADAGAMLPGNGNPDASVPYDGGVGWSAGEPVCQAGACGVSCPMGMTKCGDGLCYDTNNFHDKCGSCDTACAADTEWCNGGHCCELGKLWCSSACVDVLTDPANCGGCGNACGGNTPYCDQGKCVMGCAPTGQRRAFNTLQSATTTGCWNTGNPCGQDQSVFSSTYGRNFQGVGQQVTCASSQSACVGNVGIGTYTSTTTCQGTWDVFCDNTKVGQIATSGKSCGGTAMTNGCKLSFTPRPCTTIKLTAVSGTSANCCGGTLDSMLVAVSAW